MILKNPLSGFLHLCGAILSVVGLVFLIIAGHDSVWKIVAFSIYGAALILLFTFSTLYHWLPRGSGGPLQVFRKLDHLAIYFLIAGTYTPFCLITLRGTWGWSLFGVIWGLAILAIALQAIYINVWRWLTTTLYIFMGWLIVVATKPLLTRLPTQAFLLLLLGGIIYSLGGVIYTLRKPNLSRWFGYHELWHTLVILGALAHFLAIYWYLA